MGMSLSISLGGMVLALYVKYGGDQEVTRIYRRIIHSIWGGVLIGVISLFAYLYSIGVLRDAVNSIVINQLVLNAKYRHIPSSVLLCYPGDMLLAGVIGAVVLLTWIRVYWASRFHEKNALILPYVLCCIVGAFVPYAVSRIDIVHLFPVILLEGITCLLLYSTQRSKICLVSVS